MLPPQLLLFCHPFLAPYDDFVCTHAPVAFDGAAERHAGHLHESDDVLLDEWHVIRR
jgi:hypothetical protein